MDLESGNQSEEEMEQTFAKIRNAGIIIAVGLGFFFGSELLIKISLFMVAVVILLGLSMRFVVAFFAGILAVVFNAVMWASFLVLNTQGRVYLYAFVDYLQNM